MLCAATFLPFHCQVQKVKTYEKSEVMCTKNVNYIYKLLSTYFTSSFPHALTFGQMGENIKKSIFLLDSGD